MHSKHIRRLIPATMIAVFAALASACGSMPHDPNLKAGPSVAIPSDGRLSGSWWMHPNGAKLK